MEKKELVIASKLDNICEVHKFVADIVKEFKLDEHFRVKMTLPLVEAVNNSILYGNKLNPEKVVKIVAIKAKSKIFFVVDDEGIGFQYMDIPDPTTPEKLMEVAGRGLYLMIKFADQLYFHKNGARVVISFFTNL